MSTQSLPLNVKDTFSRMSHEYNQYTAIQSTYSTMYTHWIAVYRDERNEHTNVKKLEYLRLHTYTVQQCTADKCSQLTHTEYMLWECTLSLPQRPTNKCCRVQLCEILKKSPFRKSSLNIPLKKKREKKSPRTYQLFGVVLSSRRDITRWPYHIGHCMYNTALNTGQKQTKKSQ